MATTARKSPFPRRSTSLLRHRTFDSCSSAGATCCVRWPAMPLPARCSIVEASEVVGMDERPRDAIRRKKDSSMRVAVNLVKKGEATACVSAGNTGALLATARFVLGMIPGIDRPAIVSAVPTAHGHTVMLDLGANPDCSADQPRPVRRHGLGHRDRPARHRPSSGRAAEHRRGRHQGHGRDSRGASAAGRCADQLRRLRRG